MSYDPGMERIKKVIRRLRIGERDDGSGKPKPRRRRVLTDGAFRPSGNPDYPPPTSYRVVPPEEIFGKD